MQHRPQMDMDFSTFIKIVVLLAALPFETDSASCQEGINSIDGLFVTNETVKGVYIINVPSDTTTMKWEFIIKDIDKITSTRYLEDVRRKFIVSENATFSVFLEETLNKEEFYTGFQNTADTITTTVSCTEGGTRIPSVLVISNQPVNEFAPTFRNPNYYVSIKEDLPIGTTFWIIRDNVTDADRPPELEFNSYGITNEGNVLENFEIKVGSLGGISVKKLLDYDTMPMSKQYILTMFVDDSTHSVKTATLTVNIQDVDDQKPAFIFSDCTQPCGNGKYEVHTESNYKGVLNVKPNQISAMDQDSLNYSMTYSIIPDPYGIDGAFSIDPTSGEMKQIGVVTKSAIVLTIKAQENGGNRFFERATLLILLGNTTIADVPKTGSSTAPADSNDLKTILIVVAVVALIVIVLIMIGFLLYHRKMKALMIRPDDDRSQSPETDEEELSPDTKSEGGKSKELLLNPVMLPTPHGKAGQLPPLQMRDTATETEVAKKRSRRRKKNREPEIYDGTREYEKEVDTEFFKSGDKQKIKRSTRSKDTKTDPKYWMTVQNDEPDI